MHASRSLLLAALLPAAATAAVVAGRQAATTTTSSTTPTASTSSTLSATPATSTSPPTAVTTPPAVTPSDAPPLPTGTPAAGGFPVCDNKNRPFAPFCLPSQGSTLNPGTTYYITWNPNFFDGTNATVVVTGSFVNATDGSVTTQAFASPKLAAAWAFYAWTVEASLLANLPAGQSAVNVSLFIAALNPGAAAITPFRGPTIVVANPAPFVPEPSKPPTGPALYIGLPAVLGLVVLMLIGTCVWNRKKRFIGLGNIMGRGRHGYGVGKSRAQRVLGGASRRRREKKEGIRLMEREVGAGGEARFRDREAEAAGDDDGFAGWDQQVPGRTGIGAPRRDSDALGSLAGTPTEERRMEVGNGNAFRDEVRRQDRDRI